MPHELPFPHHTYQSLSDEGKFEIVASREAGLCRDPQPRHCQDVAARLRAAEVDEIILIHGTFAGNDVLGLIREIARWSPRMAKGLKSITKTVFDQLAGDLGNYTKAFADRCYLLVNDGYDASYRIKVRRFHWSGENHHVGRIGGAIGLLDYLTSKRWEKGQRVLLWGHSHGGNLLAAVSLLLGATPEARHRFFSATRVHYRHPILGRLDLPILGKSTTPTVFFIAERTPSNH